MTSMFEIDRAKHAWESFISRFALYNSCNAGATDIYVIAKLYTYPFDTYFTKILGVAIYSHGRVLRVIFTILTRKCLFWAHWQWFGIHNSLLHKVRKCTIIGV